jgi:glyoxylase-like metal-dependent hydrolase (beta-lactamase superfamily II)
VSQWTLRRAVMGVGAGGYAEPGQTAELVEVAPGVFHAVGSSHHSMVVEMADHLVVVEAPLYEERSLAVIGAIEERFPDKPIRYAVVTHFHMDHSGGVRAYAARGATVIAHESIVPFLESVLARPSTVRPDSLAQATDLTPTVEGMGEMRELTDGARTIQLRLVPNEHATGMVIAYLPEERIAFVSDLYSPPAPVAADNANARAFYQAVAEANLQVDQVLGGHGTGPGPFRALETVMASN